MADSEEKQPLCCDIKDQLLALMDGFDHDDKLAALCCANSQVILEGATPGDWEGVIQLFTVLGDSLMMRLQHDAHEKWGPLKKALKSEE